MGNEGSRKIETEAAAPCPAPAWIKLGVCLTGRSVQNGHWLCEAECTAENSGLELFLQEGAPYPLIFPPSFFLPPPFFSPMFCFCKSSVEKRNQMPCWSRFNPALPTMPPLLSFTCSSKLSHRIVPWPDLSPSLPAWACKCAWHGVYLIMNLWNFRGNICDVSQSWGWKTLIKIVPFSGLDMGGISHISTAKKRRASKSHLVAFLSDWRVGSVKASAQISKCRPLLSILKQMAESQSYGRGQWQIWSHGWISTPVNIGPVYQTCDFFPLALDY